MNVRKTQPPSAKLLLVMFLGIFTIGSSFLIMKRDYTVIEEEHFGGGRFDAFNQVKETFSGGYIAVGKSKSRSEGKEDFYILLADKDCQMTSEKRLGRGALDIATAVALSNDGGYVIVGYTEDSGSDHKGGLDAVVLKLDENLKDVWFESEALSTAADEQFNDIITVENEGYVLTGIQNNQLMVLMIDNNGKERWTYRLTDYLYSEGFSIIQSATGDLILTGSAGTADHEEKMNAIALSLSTTGDPFWMELYENDGLTSGHAIIQLDNGNFAIGAEAFGKVYKQDGALILTSPDGTMLQTKVYGFREYDAIYGITQNFAGDLYLGGQGRDRGQKREKAWILKVNAQDGSRIWRAEADKANYLGGEKRDQILDVIHTVDGSILTAGFTTRTTKSGQAWLVKLDQERPSQVIPTLSDITFSSVSLEDVDGNDIITTGERGHLRVTIKNNSDQDFYDLGANIHSEDDGPINFLNGIKIGALKSGTTSAFSVPIYPSLALEIDTVPIHIQLTQTRLIGGADQPILLDQNFTYPLATNSKAEPELAFEDLEFESLDGDGFRRGSRIRLVGNVVNRGNLRAHKVNCQFFLPNRVTNYSPRIVPYGDLEPGESNAVSIEFSPEFVYFDDSVELQLVLLDSTTDYGIERSMTVGISEEEIKPQPINRDLLAEWVGFSDSTQIVVNNSVFGVRLFLYSNEPIAGDNILLKRDGATLQSLTHQLEQSIHDTENQTLYRYQNRYFGTFSLKEGLNEIHAQVSNSDGTFETSTIKVTFEPLRPKLHLLSIGVPMDQVKQFATNDADVFATTFENAGKIYFDTIITNLKSDRRATFERDIASSFLQLKRDYFSGIINPEDVLLVFISSHATVNTPGTFKIKASNFNGFYPDLTSIDYVDIVERFLGQINCQKLVFLDTFNEFEETDEDEDQGEDQPLLSQVFIDIMKEQPNSTPVILACRPGQASFEDTKLGHGLFAHAIFVALNNKEKLIDADRNNVITVQEFFTELQRGVRDMASSSNPQEPYWDPLKLKDDFTIIQVNAF